MVMPSCPVKVPVARTRAGTHPRRPDRVWRRPRTRHAGRDPGGIAYQVDSGKVSAATMRVEHEGQLARETHDQLRLDRRLMNGDFKAFGCMVRAFAFRTPRRRRSQIAAERRSWRRRRCRGRRRR